MNVRRDLLASTCSLMLSDADRDAELIATCAAICDLERGYDAAGPWDSDTADKERSRIVAEQDALADRMCELPCTSLAGVQAIATALATWDRELLKEGSAKDLGELITSCLVERLLALPAPSQPFPMVGSGPIASHPDADLLAVCSEFCTSQTALVGICEADPEPSDEARDAMLAPILASWDTMLDRMAGLQANTSEGLAARATALAQHSGIKPGSSGYAFEFLPGDRGGITGRLLHMLLTDAVRMGCVSRPNPDAGLLALRPEFDRLHAVMIDYNTPDLIPEGGTECADFDALCDRIASASPAVTADGRAFQAAAAMHHLTYRLNDCEQERNPVWLMLKGIAGDAYRSVEAAQRQEV